MNKQNSIYHSFLKVTLLFLLLPVFECTAIEKQQQILLDTNGKPLSNEILLLLSSSSKKLSQIKKYSKSHSKPAKKTSKNKTYNPHLEKELLYYLKLGQIPKVNQLLKKGVKPVYKNLKGETPLGVSVMRGWASMVLMLINHGANIHEKGIGGLTLLDVASAHGMIDVAKVLIRNGLSPHSKTDKDWTPLHIAARFGHWKLVQYYVDIGINPNIRNSDGKTALGLARNLNHQGVIKILSRVTRVKSHSYKTSKKHQRIHHHHTFDPKQLNMLLLESRILG